MSIVTRNLTFVHNCSLRLLFLLALIFSDKLEALQGHNEKVRLQIPFMSCLLNLQNHIGTGWFP